MAFIHEDFLLQNKTAQRLYHQYAEGQPIIDYHCHLPPGDLASNRHFRNLFEIWLEGDHYKWRAMRTNGVAERYCTGDAEPKEKFLAWARTVPNTLRNPLYHWAHLELLRYFGISTLLDETTAESVWARANDLLAGESLTAYGILRKFDVRVVCTTDDPVDSLDEHRALAASDLKTKVYPAFRPDKALRTENPAEFNAYVEQLGARANVSISTLGDLLTALKVRHDYFHEMGCRASDHGLDRCFADFPTETQAAAIFAKVRGGNTLSAAESEQFASYLMVYFGHLDKEKGWTKQLHLGAFRNVNPAMLNKLGRDVGFDSVGDLPQAAHLGAYLGRLSLEDALPKTIIYNLNPADNYAFATMIGNFQDGSVAGKIQFGSGWWFLDQKEGIELQLNALSSTGLLSRFVGMLTDSRSFMSYPRHEYFRRVLCNMLGSDIEAGLLPDDEALVGKMVRNICFDNAAAYFEFPGVTAERASGAVRQ
jgi:glucuronate isomerase